PFLPLFAPWSQTSPACVFVWLSPHTGNVQSLSHVAVSVGPSSHCSTPISLSPSPHTLKWQLALQRFPGPLLPAPSSQVSPCSMMPSPHSTLWQVAEQVSPMVPLFAP